jgi:hypothetical protein
VLSKASWSIGVHLYPDIPSELLAACRKTSQIPKEELVFGLIDLSGNEDGDNCLLFGQAGLYIHNPSDSAHSGSVAIPYVELSKRTFVNHGDAIYLGRDQFLHNSEGAVADCETLLNLLNKVRECVQVDQPKL